VEIHFSHGSAISARLCSGNLRESGFSLAIRESADVPSGDKPVFADILIAMALRLTPGANGTEFFTENENSGSLWN